MLRLLSCGVEIGHGNVIPRNRPEMAELAALVPTAHYMVA
jgi:alpha-D-ribose 1-methylphosphonate 5-triphosphate synthase subunit PhnG